LKKSIQFIRYILLVISAAVNLLAQELLMPEDAVKLALKNNFSIIISGKQVEIAGNNATAGNAGMYPSLDITGRQNNSIQSVNQEYLDGRIVNKSGASTTTLEAAIQLNWTVFDGMGMFIERDKLDKQKELSGLALKENIENIIYKVLTTYYEIVKQNRLLKATSESVTISRERLALTQQKLNAGATSKMELLQAQVDLNNDILDSLDKATALKNMKTDMNNLLNRAGNPDFNTTDIIDVDSSVIKNRLYQAALASNTQLLSARKDSTIGALDIEAYKSEYYPKLSVYGGYNYSYLTSESGFQKANTTRGLNYGLSLSFNLFDGMNTSRKIENAKIEADISSTIIRQIESDIQTAINREYNNYEGLLGRLGIENLNYETARENMQLARERLNAGRITQMEFREIQNNYIKAGSRLWETRAGIIKSITAMKLIAGELVR
jgi:outer membrane protein